MFLTSEMGDAFDKRVQLNMLNPRHSSHSQFVYRPFKISTHGDAVLSRKEAGTLWWHIMNPRSGYPARNGRISVTIVGAEGLYCDALTSALAVIE